MIYTAEMFKEAQRKRLYSNFATIRQQMCHTMNQGQYSMTLGIMTARELREELERGEHFSGFEFKVSEGNGCVVKVAWTLVETLPPYKNSFPQ